MNKQQQYLEKAHAISITPLQTSNNFFDEKRKNYVPGKRHPLGRYELIDNLTTAGNQIVFELDAKSYSANYELAKKILIALDNRKIKYNIFASGGKGLHIEVWFSPLKITNDEFLKLYKEAIQYGFSYKHIRLWLWNLVLDEAGIKPEIRGSGKIIDDSCMQFDDLLGKQRLLRVVGGRKQIFDNRTGESETFYKTLIPVSQFNNKKPNIKQFDQVLFPDVIPVNQIDEFEIANLFEQFVSEAKLMNKEKVELIASEKIGGYTNLEAVKTIREGLKAGNRSFGAQILAIAMANDGLSYDKQQAIMEEYVKNCSQIGSPFVISEALMWIKWMAHQDNVFWNCSLTERLGIHNKADCQFCKESNKESLKFLSTPNLLSNIKEVLDSEIVGEDDTKMLMFLLILSKDFPSKTGKPGWNVFGDPMSQNIILSSDSSSGKTWITKVLLSLFGEKDKDYFIVSRYTKNAINYYTEINMDGKVIFIEELQGLDENTTQLRVWMSEGELTLTTVEKLKDASGNEVNTLVQKTTVGQPVFITNQAEGIIEDQLGNRGWILETDTSTQQTAKILDFQDRVNKIGIKKLSATKRAISDALAQLQPYHFVIPFADWRLLQIPIKDVRSRRDYQKFLTLIKCSAYLHQMQRPIVKDLNNNEFLVCNLDDYEIAIRYSSGILGAAFSGLTNQQIQIINFIKTQDWRDEFQISDLMRNLGKSQPYWYGQLKQLANLGYLTITKNVGNSNLYSIVLDKALNVISLPARSEIEKKLPQDLLHVLDSDSKVNYEELQKLVIAVIGDEALDSQEFSQEDDFAQKPSPIISHGLHASRKITSENSNETSEIIGSVIGDVSRTDIIEYVKKSKKHWVEIANIIDKFGQEEKVKTIIEEMTKKGECYKNAKNEILLI